MFDTNENRAWNLSDNRIKDLIWHVGEDVGIFGFDFPYNCVEKIAYAIQHIRDLDIPDTAKEKILGGNLKRELNI